MTRNFIKLLAATSALSASIPVFAQDSAPQASDDSVPQNDIIVTARRSNEKLQDVPVSIQAISGDTLSKLAITSADEISKLAPGLTLVNSRASTEVTLRGVTWRPGSGTPATPIYFNEVPFDPGQTLVSLFDIGQIEVLRGPQGTSRGAPSISGAVTITTKRPDLVEFGGFVQGQYGEGRHYDVQAAFNAPIIKDVLAIRLATNIEEIEGNRVFSVNSTVRPLVRDRSYRATVLFKPTDTISVEGMYQRRITKTRQFDQVVGTGSPGAPASPTAFFGGLGAIPANFNGPALTVDQRRSVESGPGIADDKIDLLTLNASWQVLGHKLSYNYGRQFNRGPTTFSTTNSLNITPGFMPLLSVTNQSLPAFTTNEIRWSSEPSDKRPFDYDIGWFSKHSGGTILVSSPFYLPGAFGGPNALPGAVTTPNQAYVLRNTTSIFLGQVFDSFYGDVRFHIDHRTELSGGLAIVRDRVPVNLNIQTFAALNNVAPLAVIKLSIPAAFRPFFPTCESVSASLITSTNYPGSCDAPVPAGVGNATQNNNDKYTDALYNFSLSHKFTDDVLVYANTGSSFRTGLPAINNQGLPANLVTPRPETAKTYEIGIKTTFGRRLHINAAAFQIDYKNQLTAFQGVQYFNTISGKAAQTSIAFYRNVDSRVRGFELEVAAQPTNQLSLGANMSYSQIKSRGGLVPANPGDCAAAVAVSATNPINFCPSPSGQILNQEAPFQATANGSYDVPIGPVDGYFRFNLAFKGKNPNYGNFSQAGVFKPTPSYAILDLFAGVSGGKGAWELGVFAKNVTNKKVELTRVTPLNNIYSPYAVAPGGYDQVRVSLPREVGVTFRYAFGSR